MYSKHGYIGKGGNHSPQGAGAYISFLWHWQALVAGEGLGTCCFAKYAIFDGTNRCLFSNVPLIKVCWALFVEYWLPDCMASDFCWQTLYWDNQESVAFQLQWQPFKSSAWRILLCEVLLLVYALTNTPRNLPNEIKGLPLLLDHWGRWAPSSTLKCVISVVYQ